MTSATKPFADLSPDCILDALESIGVHSDGRLLALNSYENRVYQIGIEQDSSLIAKFYRPARWNDLAILEEHAFVQSLADAEIPVVAPLRFAGKSLQHFNDYRFTLFAKHGGRAPELDQHGVLEWLGRFIGRIHAIGALNDFSERPTLDIASYGIEPSQYLLEQRFLPPELSGVYHGVIQQALEGVQHCFDRAGDVNHIRLHGDCHTGNILWTADGPHFVDFDDSRMGPAVQDLWMLLSGNPEEMSKQMSAILSGYESFYEFDLRQMHLIEALRTLRLIHYAAWIARRWADPAFPQAFPWFNTQRYWQDRILELREQIANMEESPLLLKNY